MKLFLTPFILLPLVLFGQQGDLQRIIDQEYENGHFNGAILYVDLRNSIKINKGPSNMQFAVRSTARRVSRLIRSRSFLYDSYFTTRLERLDCLGG